MNDILPKPEKPSEKKTVPSYKPPLAEKKEADEREEALSDLNEALDSLKELQPEIEWGKLKDHLASLSDTLLIDFKSFVWELAWYTFSKKGISKINKQVQNSDQISALIGDLGRHVRLLSELKCENASEEIYLKGEQALLDLSPFRGVSYVQAAPGIIRATLVIGEEIDQWEYKENTLPPTNSLSQNTIELQLSAQEEMDEIDKQNLSPQQKLAALAKKPNAFAWALLKVNKSIATSPQFAEIFLTGDLDVLLMARWYYKSEVLNPILKGDEYAQLSKMSPEEQKTFFLETFIPRLTKQHPDVIIALGEML